MKKILGLLTLVLITAILSATLTFFVVSRQYAERRAWEQDSYEKQIEKLEAQVAGLEAAVRQVPAQAVAGGAAVPANPSPSANIKRTGAASVPGQPAISGGPGGALAQPALADMAVPPVAVPPAMGQVPESAPGSLVHYDAATSGSKCRIDGTSSIHPWKMETPIIGGFLEMVNLDPAQSTPANVGGDGRVAANAEAAIPVRSLKSYSIKMDEVYQDHMEATVFRKIQYRLQGLVLKKVPHAPNTPFEFDSRGEITVHGVTNLLAMPVKIERLDSTKLKISGTSPLKMSDFKVQPPSPLIAGVQIKTGDEITISFEWVVERSNVTIIPKSAMSKAQ